MPACRAEGDPARTPAGPPRDAAAQLVVQLEAITAAAAAGLKDHDRWLTQRTLLARKLAGRRATSKLPALLDYVLTRPIVSAGMIAEELGITARAAQNLVAELGLREATGRGRYRAWGNFLKNFSLLSDRTIRVRSEKELQYSADMNSDFADLKTAMSVLFWLWRPGPKTDQH